MDEEINVLAVGKPAPKFTAPAYHQGNVEAEVSLDDMKGKWVLLFFYPLDFTFVCPTEIIQLNDMKSEFDAINCEIVAASIDSVFVHKGWADADERIANIKYPIISDLTKEISFDYGILHDDGMSLRGAFIIDPDGILRSMTINDLPVGRNPKELLRTIKAFQTGDLCPVNWKEGEKTLGKA